MNMLCNRKKFSRLPQKSEKNHLQKFSGGKVF